MILAEDGERKQHLIGANAAGKTYSLAHKEPITGDYPEWAGPTFSPDRKTLFVGIQEEGSSSPCGVPSPAAA